MQRSCPSVTPIAPLSAPLRSAPPAPLRGLRDTRDARSRSLRRGGFAALRACAALRHYAAAPRVRLRPSAAGLRPRRRLRRPRPAPAWGAARGAGALLRAPPRGGVPRLRGLRRGTRPPLASLGGPSPPRFTWRRWGAWPPPAAGGAGGSPPPPSPPPLPRLPPGPLAGHDPGFAGACPRSGGRAAGVLRCCLPDSTRTPPENRPCSSSPPSSLKPAARPAA